MGPLAASMQAALDAALAKRDQRRTAVREQIGGPGDIGQINRDWQGFNASLDSPDADPLVADMLARSGFFSVRDTPSGGPPRVGPDGRLTAAPVPHPVEMGAGSGFTAGEMQTPAAKYFGDDPTLVGGDGLLTPEGLATLRTKSHNQFDSRGRPVTPVDMSQAGQMARADKAAVARGYAPMAERQRLVENRAQERGDMRDLRSGRLSPQGAEGRAIQRFAGGFEDSNDPILRAAMGLEDNTAELRELDQRDKMMTAEEARWTKEFGLREQEQRDNAEMRKKQEEFADLQQLLEYVAAAGGHETLGPEGVMQLIGPAFEKYRAGVQPLLDGRAGRVSGPQGMWPGSGESAGGGGSMGAIAGPGFVPSPDNPWGEAQRTLAGGGGGGQSLPTGRAPMLPPGETPPVLSDAEIGGALDQLSMFEGNPREMVRRAQRMGVNPAQLSRWLRENTEVDGQFGDLLTMPQSLGEVGAMIFNPLNLLAPGTPGGRSMQPRIADLNQRRSRAQALIRAMGQ